MGVTFLKRVLDMLCVLIFIQVVVYVIWQLNAINYLSGITNNNVDKIKTLSNFKHGTRAMDSPNRNNSERRITLTSKFHKEKTMKTANITVRRNADTHAVSSVTTKLDSSKSHVTSLTNKVINTSMDQLPFLKQARRETERILRDSIADHHMHNFIKPENESCEKRLPVCIIVGVNKCGTREIMDFLRLHPHIPKSSSGFELPYFMEDKHYERGKNWLKRKVPCSYSNQVTIIEHGHYFHDRKVPERIKRFNNSIQLILLVREPFSRALSHYRFRRMIGLLNPRYANYVSKNFSSFVLNKNKETVNKKAFFVRQSIYDEPMLKWLEYFNLSQFLIIENEEFKQDPVTVLQKVEKFLGLKNYIKPDMFVFNHDKGFYCIQSNRTDTGNACYYSNRGNKTNFPIPKSIESKLKKFFKEKNERFFRIIGKSYNWK